MQMKTAESQKILAATDQLNALNFENNEKITHITLRLQEFEQVPLYFTDVIKGISSQLKVLEDDNQTIGRMVEEAKTKHDMIDSEIQAKTTVGVHDQVENDVISGEISTIHEEVTKLNNEISVEKASADDIATALGNARETLHEEKIKLQEITKTHDTLTEETAVLTDSHNNSTHETETLKSSLFTSQTEIDAITNELQDYESQITESKANVTSKQSLCSELDKPSMSTENASALAKQIEKFTTDILAQKQAVKLCENQRCHLLNRIEVAQNNLREGKSQILSLELALQASKAENMKLGSAMKELSMRKGGLEMQLRDRSSEITSVVDDLQREMSLSTEKRSQLNEARSGKSKGVQDEEIQGLNTAIAALSADLQNIRLRKEKVRASNSRLRYTKPRQKNSRILKIN
jgi:chromosome segregation ATPase